MKTIEIQPFLDSLEVLEKKEKALTKVYHAAVRVLKATEEIGDMAVQFNEFVELKQALKRAKKYV